MKMCEIIIVALKKGKDLVSWLYSEVGRKSSTLVYLDELGEKKPILEIVGGYLDWFVRKKIYRRAESVRN